MSTSPGSTHFPLASMTFGQCVSSRSSAETAATWPSLIPMLRMADGAPVPSNHRPFRMTVSNWVSLHGTMLILLVVQLFHGRNTKRR
ncbi:Uncharacterised protein [Mycobacteroides abscessus subsp. abscessus]|nr:Uncharacterised protein [Mycobacteroides abscessus subsp. abscessus]